MLNMESKLYYNIIQTRGIVPMKFYNLYWYNIGSIMFGMDNCIL